MGRLVYKLLSGELNGGMDEVMGARFGEEVGGGMDRRMCGGLEGGAWRVGWRDERRGGWRDK